MIFEYDAKAAHKDWLWNMFKQFGWLFTGIVCLILGYLLVWQRGLFLDDYSLYDAFTNRPLFDILKGAGFPFRAVNYTTAIILNGLLPKHEFLIRLFLAVAVGINALLLGSLVYKVLGSRLAGVVSGWLFLMPFFAWEATLWASAGAYIVAANLLLISLHAFLHAITHQQIISHWGGIGVIGFVLILFTGEQFALPMGFLPILVGITTSQYIGKAVRQAMYILILLAIIASIVYFSVYYNLRRGGVARMISISCHTLVTRTQEFFDNFSLLTFDKHFGYQFTTESFALGFNTIFQSYIGIALLFVIATILLITALTWRVAQLEYTSRYRDGFIVLALGIIWFIATMLFPAMLVSGQALARRMLYLPLAGASIAIGAVAWLTAKKLQYLIWYPRLLLLAIGSILIFSTITMLGYAQLLATRFNLDQQQINVLIRTLPQQYVPQGSYIVPYLIDERLPTKTDTIGIGKTLVGVFDIPWSIDVVLKTAYKRSDLHFITISRFGKMRVTYTCNQQPASSILNIQGQDVPIDKTIIFSYQAGIVKLIDKLIIPIIQNSNSTECVIEFPIAAKSKQRGVPTIDLIAGT